MVLELILGSLVAAVGTIAMTSRRWFARTIHLGLKVFFGEPVADDAVRPSTPIHIAIAGAVIAVLGGSLIVQGLLSSWYP